MFAQPVRKDILAPRGQLAAGQAPRRQRVKTQNRSEVTTSKTKIYRQKGTGRARHGSRNANIFRGGGVAHGPRRATSRHDLPKKVRRLG